MCSIPTYLQQRRYVPNTHLSPTEKICAQYPPISTFLQHITLTDYKCKLILLFSILCIQQGGRSRSVAWGSKRFLDQINKNQKNLEMSSYHLKSFNNVHSFCEVHCAHCNWHTTEVSVIIMTINTSVCMTNAPYQSFIKWNHFSQWTPERNQLLLKWSCVKEGWNKEEYN